MKSKDISNLIISLVILAAGMKIITIIAKSYVQTSVVGISPELVNSVESMGNLFILGAAVLMLVLIPFYLSKRSDEKKNP